MTPPRTEAVADDFLLLVSVLPGPLQTAVRALPPQLVLEVVMDLGRPPEARLVDRVERLRDEPVLREDLEHVLAQVGPRGTTTARASSGRCTASPPSATARARWWG